ncbi:hypothetical protein K435DRAFT_688847, partial [Dendrothele bispora CBS 962.96]
QKQLQICRDKNQCLRLQNADLKSQLALLKAPKGKRTKKTDVLLSSSEMTQLGKSFTILVAPWIKSQVFEKLPPSDAPAAHSKACFLGKPDDYWKTSNIELHAHLGDYEALKGRVNLQRSPNRGKGTYLLSVTVLRETAPLIFHDLHIDPQLWLTKSDTARKENTHLKSLLHFPGQKPETSPFSPIFYPSFTKVDHLLFMNDYLPKVRVQKYLSYNLLILIP